MEADLENGKVTIQIPDKSFHGYSLPTSSTTYTPNQFFDVVIPTSSRGCLRLVAYLIRKTLGWSDADGNPQRPEVEVSYRELIDRAGISRGGIKAAITEALERRFITCLRFGQAHRPSEAGFSASYSIKWDERENYIVDPLEFDGFYAGNGNLTHIPNDYFDYTIPREPLATVQVIGVIIRNTIGWQTKHGMRRQRVAMSFTDIMRRTGIRSRSTVSAAIDSAIVGCHIEKIEQGTFDTNRGENSKPSVYGIRWLDAPAENSRRTHGSKCVPLNSPTALHTAMVQKPDRPESVQKANRQDGSNSGPAHGSITGPASVQKLDSHRFKRWTPNKRTYLNYNPKQQAVEGSETLSRDLREVTQRLLEHGVDRTTSTKLCRTYPRDRIIQQIDWLKLRHVKVSKAGYLVRAIELDLPKPNSLELERSNGYIFVEHFYTTLTAHRGPSIIEPSQEESRIATKFLAHGFVGSASEVGQRFAEFLNQRQKGSPTRIRTLSLAIRCHGQDFFDSEIKKRALSEQEDKSAKDREAIENLRPQYDQFISSLVEQLLSKPELQKLFEIRNEARLAAAQRLSRLGHDLIKGQLDTVSGRKEAFIEFLQNQMPEKLPTFRNWCSQQRKVAPVLEPTQ